MNPFPKNNSRFRVFDEHGRQSRCRASKDDIDGGKLDVVRVAHHHSKKADDEDETAKSSERGRMARYMIFLSVLIKSAYSRPDKNARYKKISKSQFSKLANQSASATDAMNGTCSSIVSEIHILRQVEP